MWPKMLLCKALFYAVFIPYFLGIIGVHASGHGLNATSQLKHCSHCTWSKKGGCKACLHEGHKSQYQVGLRRYGRDDHRGVSAMQIAIDNHNLFKSGKVSFVLRNEGPFGSLGYDYDLHGKDTKRAYNPKHRNVSRLKNSSVGALNPDSPNEYVPLSQIKDCLYVGTMHVGTPPQELNPIFDTGSTNVWVVGTKCESETCKKVTRFNPSLSSTFETLSEPKKIHIKFGTGEIEGKPGKDMIRIGGMAFEQAFAVVEKEEDNQASTSVFEKINFEGIVGLAFTEMSSIPGPSVLDNMTNLNLLNRDEFAFYLGDEGGEALLMFGGANPEFYEGNLMMFPVAREHYWEVELDAIYVGTKKICCNEKSYVIFDSGTSLNSVPSSEFKNFVSLIENKCHSDLNDLTLTYVLGGQEIKLEPYQYIYKNDDKCTPAFMQLDVPSEFGHAYVLGSAAFMRFYFTVFRRGDGTQPSMVGVARAKSGPEVAQLARELALNNPN